MSNQRIRGFYSFSLVVLDAAMVAVAFVLAYQMRAAIPWPNELENQTALSGYSGLIAAQIAGVLILMFMYRQYYIPRAISRVDQFYSIFAAVSIGTLLAVAISVFSFK